MTDKTTPHEELMTPREEFWFTRVGALMIVISSPFITALIFSGPDSATAFQWILFFGSLVVMISGIFFLTQRIAIECPECKKNIYSDEPWVCSQPDCKEPINYKTTLFSFLGICQSCWKAPTAVSCFRSTYDKNVNCNGLIFLTKDKDRRWAAMSIMEINNLSKESLEEKAENLSKKVRVSKGEKELADAEVERMRAEAQKIAVKNSLDPNAPKPKKKSLKTILEEELNREIAVGIGASEIAAGKIAEYQKRYKDNPEMVNRVRDIIENWREEKSI